ncbi:hypothetical protein Rsub_01516 [Raphidocelis subcapitata]|uniref:Alfin N-terminal domain-containing protein n=1 Tax=Raphidocelis subcapitata TaxID=307507 RepID=A0A2V0NVQ0_9CHLO|nr:hypothetical protein Rsub_01516 [Raphidocelis subcapitata]|eukprot:GBF89017.1 hypothetical protein Rsub_01516 [Raphidocelis subcapitata]
MEVHTFPRTVDEIYDDYCHRRYGLQRALTDDADALLEKCDPYRENLCLYGDRSGGWAVEPPAEEIPAELPEPCLGINFARNGLSRQEWLALVAAHSDAWLVAVAFFYAVKLDSSGRARLFRQLNSQPTLFEVVTGRARPTPAPAKPGGGKRGGGSMFAEGGPTGPGAPPRLPPVPFKEKDMPASANGSKLPDPRGRRLQYEDITPRLQGKFTELYWPDDALWYLVYIDRIDVRGKTANIIYYPSEELEELDLDEIARDGHMSLLPQSGLQ